MRKTISYILTFLAILSLGVGLLPNSIVQASQPKVAFWLTVLHNNDGESDLINLGSGLEDFGGAARFKTLVDRLKWDALHGKPPVPSAPRSVVMVSSGDNFLAGPEFNASLEQGVPFYDTIAMDLIGYDAIALGNHDFDFGPDVLADFIEGFSVSKPPFLSVNLDFSGEPRLQALKNQKRIASSTTVKTPAGRIGIIGATTPMLPFSSSPRNVRVNEMVAEAIMGEVRRLEAMKINKIILISHLQSITEDLSMVPYLSGIDIIIAGGGDEMLANPGQLLVPGDETRIFGSYPLWATDSGGVQVPVVTTAGSYAYVGRLVAGFDKAGNLVMIDESKSGPVRVAGGGQPDAVPPDEEVQSRVVEPLIEALNQMSMNVIGVSEVALDGTRVNIRSRETNLGSLTADALRWQAAQLAGLYGVSVPQVALQNGGGIRNASVISPGNITELTTFSILPFPNFVSIVEGISRDQFKEILENAVSRVEFGDGRFAQVSGFRFTWDPAGIPQTLDANGNVLTVGSRVREVVLDDGTPIVADGSVIPGPDLTVATIDFLARGGDQYPFRGAAFTTIGVTYQQSLRNYIQTGLGGLITVAQYPEGGQGRISRLP